MSEPNAIDKISALDQIRLVEAEITRKIVVARGASVQRAASARAQAAPLKKRAAERGEREGQTHCKEIIAQAEEQARVIVDKAQHDAEILRRSGEARMEQAVHEALSIVLGLRAGWQINES